MSHGPEMTPGGVGEYRPGSVRGHAGFFRVAQGVAGQWTLLDPAGRPFFARAVHGVSAPPPDSDATLTRDPAVRLRTWGFNAVGVGGDGAGRDDGMPFFATADFCAAAPPLVAPGVRLPDVFAPDWAVRAAAHAAAVCGPLASGRELIGWVTDDGLAWGEPAGGLRPGLLQVCLSLEPVFAAYHAAWEFVLATHGGRLESVARAWAAPLANKEILREMTRSESRLASRGYLRDEARWTREYARRYFTGTAAAIRAADPGHLVCGCRFRRPAGGQVLAAAAYPAVDVALPHWSELPAPAAASGPVLAGDVAWNDEAFWGVPAAAPGAAPARSARLTSVERMIRRGRSALKRLARHPAVVGFIWRQWHDEPGEQPPFASGLVHLNGTAAREHTDLLTMFNQRAEAVRRAAAKMLSP